MKTLSYKAISITMRIMKYLLKIMNHLGALSPPGLLFAMTLINYHGSLSWIRTCFRIQAAISCPQSKMTWNSFAFFISFRSGLASLVSVGSCRIFKRMLYRDGALISSCSRMRPADKEDTYSVENEFERCSNIMCLICCHFKVSLILRRPQKNNWIQVFSAEKGSYACLPSHSLLILLLLLGKQTDRYRPIKRI